MSDLLGDVVGLLIADRIVRWRARRGLRRGRVHCSLRVVEGTVAGLDSTWSRGTASVTPGSLRFAFAFPKSGEATIHVLAIDSSGEDMSPTSSTSRRGSDATWHLTTPSGVLDWRVDREFIRGAAERLRSNGTETP